MSVYMGELNHNISMRDRIGLKENVKHSKVNHNPSTASPGDELVIKMPQLSTNSVLFPNSLNLTYDYTTDSSVTSADDIPDHLTSAIVERFKMTIGGKTIYDISNYNHLAIYREFWHSKQKYKTELTHRGIQSVATKSKRHSISGAADDALASIHLERYSFWLGSFLTDAAFTPQAIKNNVEFTLKFATGKYTLKNICLEYDYVDEPSIATSIKSKYDNHRHIVNDYKNHTTVTVPAAEGDFEININATYDSLRAVLIFFKADNKVDKDYIYPKIKNVKVDIDGETNQLYNTDYLPPYSWTDAMRFFGTRKNAPMHISQDAFYTDKYCLTMDLRTISDEQSSGVGREIKDYLKLKITKEVTPAGKAFVYLVSDKAIEFKNSELSSIYN